MVKALNPVKLTPDEVQRVSPSRWAKPAAGPLYAVVGADESPEFLRQNTLIRKSWGKNVVPVCEAIPGRQHFSIVDALADAGHPLNASAFELLEP